MTAARARSRSRCKTAGVTLASGVFQVGQLVGLRVLVLVVVGLVRTFSRSDLSLREKILGKKKDR